MDYIKVKGHSNLIRDLKTNSIVNTNMKDYEEYISRRKRKSEENVKIENLENDLDNIKNDISEIKSLLKEIINESRRN